MTLRELHGLVPPVLRTPLLVTEQGHDASLVVHIGSLSNERVLHLIDVLLEILFVLPSEQLFDALEAAFTLCDRVNLNALDQHLD